MKQIIKLLTLILITISFTACDSAEELLDIPIPQTIKVKIPVHIDKTNGSWDNYNNSVLLSIDTGDIHEYINKIKDVKVNKLSYKIIGFSGDPAGKVRATLSIDNIVNMQNDFVVKTEADKATVFEVTNTDELNEVGNALKNNKKFTARYSGSALCDNGDMDFMVEVAVDLKVTANPLK